MNNTATLELSEPPTALEIPTHPNCATLVFSFTMANGTEDFADNVEEFKKTVIETANAALKKQGHGSNTHYIGMLPRTNPRD